MKLLYTFSATLLVVVLFHPSVAQEPNCVKQQSYETKNGTVVSKASYSYSDGNGRVIQGKSLINSPQIVMHKSGSYSAGEIVSASVYDIVGRTVKNYSPIPREEHSVYTSDISKVNNYYDGTTGPDAKGYPFSEQVYYDNPLGRVKFQSVPGDAYALGQHQTEFYYGGVVAANGFATMTQLEATRNSAERSYKKESNAKYFLSAVKLPNDTQYTQEIKDVFGNMISNWSSPRGNGSDPVIATYKYSILGKLLEETPPTASGNTLISPTKYWYNVQGQLIKKSTPDKSGFEEYSYDAVGQLVTLTHGLRTIYYSYDDLGRQISIATGGENNTKFVKERSVYDYPQSALLYMKNSALEVLCSPTLLKNTVGRVVASIAYAEDCEAISNISNDDPPCQKRVIELFSYDDEGRISTKYISIPGLALQKITFEYTPRQGLISKETQYLDNSVNVVTEYDYNNDMQLQSIHRNGDLVIWYYYLPDGTQSAKSFFNKSNKADPEFLTVSNRFTAQGWLDSTVSRMWSLAVPVFKEKLAYDSTGIFSQFRGNITGADIEYNFDGNAITRKYMYEYDRTDRLLKVREGKTITSVIGNQWDGDYLYDNVGRITKKNEGIEHKNWGTYIYKYATGQLTGINSSPKSGQNFVYDTFGNMIIDRSKNMAIEYDWRDLPVKILFFRSLPSQISSVASVKASSECIAYVEMTYDASGNRVLKQEFKKR